MSKIGSKVWLPFSEEEPDDIEWDDDGIRFLDDDEKMLALAESIAQDYVECFDILELDGARSLDVSVKFIVGDNERLYDVCVSIVYDPSYYSTGRRVE